MPNSNATPVRPVNAELLQPHEMYAKVGQFIEDALRGANLRGEYVKNLNGGRLTLVFDWDDPG